MLRSALRWFARAGLGVLAASLQDEAIFRLQCLLDEELSFICFSSIHFVSFHAQKCFPIIYTSSLFIA